MFGKGSLSSTDAPQQQQSSSSLIGGPSQGVGGYLSSSSAFALLTRIIRNLSLNPDDVKTRENHRHFVEQQFKNLDVRINRAINDSNEELAQLIQLFNGVVKLLENCRDDVSYCLVAARTSKSLMHMRRLDIRDLWEESVKNGHLSKMYGLINELNDVNTRVNVYVREGRFVHATDLVVRAYDQQIFTDKVLDSGVGEDIRLSLLKEPHECIGKEIVEAIKIFVFGKTKDIVTAVHTLMNDDVSIVDKLSFENPDLDKLWPKHHSKLHLVIGEAIRLADKSGLEGTEDKSMSTFVLENIETCLEKRFNELASILALKHKSLADYLAELFDDFKLASEKCSLMLENINPDSVRVAWSKAEKVFTEIVYRHIQPSEMDILTKLQSNRRDQSMSLDKYYLPYIGRLNQSFAGGTGAVSGVMGTLSGVRHRAIEFKFKRSAQSAHKNHESEGKDNLPEKKMYLVCEPSIQNVQKSFFQIRKAIERFNEAGGGDLERMVAQIVRESLIAELDTDSPEITDNDQLFSISSIRLFFEPNSDPEVMLASTKSAYDSCRKLSEYAEKMPIFANDFAIAFNDTLLRHSSVFSAALADTINKSTSESGNDQIGGPLCVEWIQDCDVNRHLRSMPSCDRYVKTFKHNGSFLDISELGMVKETEMLLQNLTNTELISSEKPQRIIFESQIVRLIAYMQDSMDWLIDRVEDGVKRFNRCDYVNKETKETLNANLTFHKKLSMDFLLLLYVDIRARCFAHLLLLRPAFTILESFELDRVIECFKRDIRRSFVLVAKSLGKRHKRLKLNFLFGSTLGSIVNRMLIKSMESIDKLTTIQIRMLISKITGIDQTVTGVALATTSQKHGDNGGMDDKVESYRIKIVNEGALKPTKDFLKILLEVDCSGISAQMNKYPQLRPSEWISLLRLSYRSFGSKDNEFDVERAISDVTNMCRPIEPKESDVTSTKF